jgi:hypothetical protein
VKIVLSIFFCLVFGLNAFGQAENAENVPEITVEEISLARGDKYGKIGETVNVFARLLEIGKSCFRFRR